MYTDPRLYFTDPFDWDGAEVKHTELFLAEDLKSSSKLCV